ncbi:MAG: RNA-directed DNA polymerase [Polaribacter sp.]|jgi:RNA-directed DNA polymerase
MVLDGMAQAIDESMNIRYHHHHTGYRRRVNNPYKIHFVRYADDWIVTANSKEVLENRVKPAIEAFLKERNLELSVEKTIITSIEKGFDFLGQNFRKYKNGKLIIQPSKKSVKKLLEKKLLDKVRSTIRQMYTVPTSALIIHLNRITKGWAMYHRHCCAQQTFSWIDHHIWKAIWIWCFRRHNNKGRKWVFKRYFTQYKGNRWTLFGNDGKTTHYLYRMANLPIRSHVKIKATANPFVKEDEPIFELHLQRKMLNTWNKRTKLINLFRRQSGKCPICQEPITKQSGWNIHHKLERLKGGKDTMDNLVMLHPNCHHQVHFWNIQFKGDVPFL